MFAPVRAYVGAPRVVVGAVAILQACSSARAVDAPRWGAPSHGLEPDEEWRRPAIASSSQTGSPAPVPVEGQDEEIADEPDIGSETAAALPSVAHPLEGWSAEAIQNTVRKDPERLGPMSVGAPNGGVLFNAVQLPEDSRWERVDPSHAWGTQETVDNIARAVAQVHEQFPDSPKLPIGHISGRHGGHLNPHRSHQAGTDVDIGFYYRPDAHRWYVRGTKQTLDLPRTWALVRAFVTETDVRFILLDHSIQALLREYATSIGENEAWLDDVFKGHGPTRPPLIRHAKGHATHLHVRFYSPVAEETGRRCYPALLSVGKIKPATHFVSYKAKKGDTLLSLAKRFGTTVKAIKRVNGLRSNTILAKRSYKIPSTGHSVHASRVVEVPPRRLPPGARQAVVGSSKPGPGTGEGDWQECTEDHAGGDCE